MKFNGLDKIIKDIQDETISKKVISQHTNIHGGNVVYEATPEYIKQVPDAVDLIFKSNPIFSVMDNELQTIKTMHSQNSSPRYEIEVIKPLYPEVIISTDNQNYILLQKCGPSLKKHTNDMNQEELTVMFSRIARFIAISHLSIGRPQQGINEYDEYLKYSNRMINLSDNKDIFIQKEIKEITKLIEYPMRKIYEIFSLTPIFYRKDPKVDNWHFKKNEQTDYKGKLVAIDWEGDRSKCPPEFEISKLVYQGSHLNGGSHLILNDVVDEYLDEFKRVSGREYSDKRKFIKKTHLANIPKSFTLTAYAFDKPYLKNDILSYLSHAVESIQLLHTNGDFNKPLKESYTNLYQGMSRLNELMREC